MHKFDTVSLTTHSRVNQYIARLCATSATVKNPSIKNLSLKAYSEFLLYCSVLDGLSILSGSMSQRCKEISKHINALNFADEMLIVPNGLLISIGITEKITSETEFDNFIDRKNLAMEVAYAIEKSGKKICDNYWEVAGKVVVEKAYNEELTAHIMYLITHVVMFGTDFGNRDSNSVWSPKLKNVLSILVKMIEAHCLEISDWDLMLEACLCTICLELPLTSRGAEEMNQKLKMVPEVDGLCLSNGQKSQYEIISFDNPFDQVTYNMYHTSLVKLMIEAKLHSCTP